MLSILDKLDLHENPYTTGSDGDFTNFKDAVHDAWETVCARGRTKLQVLIGQKDFGAADLLLHCTTPIDDIDGLARNVLESSAVIAAGRGNISKALDIQWTLLHHNADTEYDISPDDFEDILELTKIACSQVSRVARRHGLDEQLCTQLIQPIYSANSPKVMEVLFEHLLVDVSQKIPEIIHPIKLGLCFNWPIGRAEAAEILQIMLSHGIGHEFVRSWRLPGYHIKIFKEEGSIIHYAAALRYPKLVDVLLKNGADPRHRDSVGCTPIHIAMRSAATEVSAVCQMIEPLISAGADINATDDCGDTPMHYVLREIGLGVPLKRVLEALLSHGSRVDMPNVTGDTVLHFAARTGEWPLLELLLEACKISGYPINPMNRDGMTPLDVCRGNIEAKKTFQQWAIANGYAPLVIYGY